jgi:hypothetical protein
MTGFFVNEKLQKIILSELYDKRKSGEPVILNNLWRRNIENSSQFRITLQYLFSDKKYIWCDKHRDIGNKINYIEQTLDNVTVRAKITEPGIAYYRKEYRDELWKYWGLRFGVLAIVLPFVWRLYKTIKN